MDAAEDDAASRWWQRWGWLPLGALVVLLFAASIAVYHSKPDYLPRQKFAGCYVSGNGDPLELDPSGSLRSRGSAVGRFNVDAPVGGKHGPLIDIDGVSVRMRGANVYFERGREGYSWDVSKDGLQVVFPPDHSVVFKRAAASYCG